MCSGHLGAFDVVLTVTDAMSGGLPSGGAEWLPIMTYSHPHNMLPLLKCILLMKLVNLKSMDGTIVYFNY